MELYRLKKDLPTFEAGDLFEMREDGLYLYSGRPGENHWKRDVMAYHKVTLEKFPNILTDWFKKVEITIPKTTNISDKWEKEGSCSRLAQLIVAPEDFKVGDKEYFTWDEAMEATKDLPDGWRMPSRHEWVLLAEEFGQNDKGELDANVLSKELNMSFGGWVAPQKMAEYNKNPKEFNDYTGVGTDCLFWSTTVNSYQYSYLLYMSTSGYMYPQNGSYKLVGFPVRLVKDVKVVTWY